ncbi:hypothetical protein BGX31_009087 [Mortierella sp. GBA43]|nr:hypothetical protein BGX31_009087 [Mortierella sp. GBA43]
MHLKDRVNKNRKPIDRCLPYSKDWLRLASGAIIMEHFNRIPKLITTKTASFFTMEHAKGRFSKIIRESQLHRLDAVPTNECLGPILRELNNVECDVVFIPGVGAIMSDAAPHLSDIRHTKEFAQALHDALLWINMVLLGDENKDLLDTLRRRFIDHDCLFESQYSLDLFHGILPMASIFALCENEWLDDTILDVIMAFSRYSYHREDTVYLMIEGSPDEDAHHVAAHIKNGQVKIVFAFVHMANHWGVARLDLE